MDTKRNKPFNDVFLAGRPIYSDDYIAMLKNAGVFVHGIIITDSIFESADSSVPVIPMERYIKMLERRNIQSIPLIVLDSASTDGVSYFISFIDLLCQLTENLPEIYHSSCIAKYSKGCCEGEIAFTGYPGTGFILMSALVMELLQHKKTPLPSHPLKQFMAVQGILHSISLTQCIKRILSPLDIKEARISAQLTFIPRTKHLRAVMNDGNYLVIDPLPWTGFLGETMSAHILWFPTTREFFDRHGYKVFHSMRNPIDTIASNAAKTYRPLTRALHNDQWFRLISKQIAVYNQLAVEQQDAYTLVKYEDIINEPLKQLRRLSDVLEIDISEEEISAIWDKIGFKPLTPAGKEHLYQPGKSKLKYFSAEHIEIMESDGHEALARTYGYEWPDKDKQRELLPVSSDKNNEEWKTPSRLYGRIDRFACHHWRDEQTGVTCLASAPYIIEALRANIESKWFRIYHGSLGDLFAGDFPKDIYDLFPG